MDMNYSSCFFTDLIFFLRLPPSPVPPFTLFLSAVPLFFSGSLLLPLHLTFPRASRCPNQAATRLSPLTIYWR